MERRDSASADRWAALAGALMALPDEFLRKVDIQNMDLGAFLKSYVTTPEAEELGTRSSIREDVVVREVARLLVDTTEKVTVLDACCGFGTVARRIARGLNGEEGRVEYIAVDRDTGCIGALRAESEQFARFASFTTLQRDITDLRDIPAASVHLVVVNNALHEIAPRNFPQVFATLTSLLEARIGRICLIDMESLPAEAPEHIAITWSASEVRTFLQAGGFQPEITVHDKVTTVFQAHVRPPVTSLNLSAMKTSLRHLLTTKLRDAVTARRVLDLRAGESTADLKRWIVATGSVARLIDELLALGANLEQSFADRSVQVV